MKVMVFVKATQDSEVGRMPEQQLLIDMLNYNEELVKAGIMKGGDGLKPTSEAVRIRFSGTSRSVMDGPFPETKEQVAGFWIWEVKDMAEAIEWVKKCPNPMFEDSDIDIRPVYGIEDFGDIVTPELKEKEERLQREASGANAKARQIFVNLPVADLDKSKAFFNALGFSFNPMFTDNTAACMIVSSDIYVMLLTRSKFESFSPNPVIDAQQSTEVLTCISCNSREEVDSMVATAVRMGGRRYNDAKDYGFMYQHGFQDPDGHVWELVYMSGEPG